MLDTGICDFAISQIEFRNRCQQPNVGEKLIGRV